MKQFTFLSLLTLSLPSMADTIGLWRFEETGATSGSPIAAAANTNSPGSLDAAPNGGEPLYSDDVPFAEIFDPIANQTYANTLSFDASGGNARLAVPNDLSLDSSFTVEFFVKMSSEPTSFESIFDRREFADLVWKVDFDHNFTTGFGRIRTRWDTPAGAPDDVATTGVDENVNFVLGPLGNASGPKIYIDTGAKDENDIDVGPQNTGNPNDYIYDAGSTNPNETDVALQGDGINDVPEWHHVAMSFDETTGEIKFYFDYALSQVRTLADTEGDGYTHPAADLRFGKLSAGGYGLLLDEVRYSDDILTTSDFLRPPATGGGNTTGYWRMEKDGAAAGDDIFEVTNEVSALHPAVGNSGTPKYSADVPASSIYDPVSDLTYPNQFSMDATLANSRLQVANDAAFDTSFSLEFFIKLKGEPGGYQPFFRRLEQNDLRWQLDFDYAKKGSFGRLRSRFDTPGSAGPDGMNDVGVDENINFVLGPQGGANVPDNLRLWIDTDLGDGMSASYDDPVDWSMDGDGENDIDAWHHAAITFDEETGAINFYYDYELVQSRILPDTLGDGYTHPAAPLLFGKFAGADYGLLLDEIRYSGEVLKSFQFLEAVTVAPKELEITSIVYDSATPSATVTWNSINARLYSVDHSTDLENWLEILEEEPATGDTMSHTDTNLRDGSPKVFYRVREIE
ncbi:LamG domain-containing protein [Akkermansiaceae bacterium]|nr:LamG domain-containing protein [Akkermansiaceae bacterium]